MMSGLYPVVLKLEGKRCLVVGSGYEADEKARALESAGASVTRKQAYEPGDLAGYFLVIASTGETETEQIWREANDRGTLCNSVDDAPHCNFILPAVHRRGDLIVAVSSSGKSPALATRVRDRIAGELGPEYSVLLDMLGELRATVRERFERFEDRKRIYARMVDSGALELLQGGDRESARAVLLRAMEE